MRIINIKRRYCFATGQDSAGDEYGGFTTDHVGIYIMSSVNTLIGMPDFQTTTTVPVKGCRFRNNKKMWTECKDQSLTQVFKSHNRELQSFELSGPKISGDSVNDATYDVYGSSEFLDKYRDLHYRTTGLYGIPSFSSDPDGIICLLIPEDNCIVQRKPICYVHINGKPTQINVQFPLDVLNGPDFTTMENAFYTGSVNLIDMDDNPVAPPRIKDRNQGKHFGAPSTIHGNIFPVVRDSGTDGKSSASDGRCNNVPAVVITIMTMGMPLEQYARMVYFTAVQDIQWQGNIEPRKAVAFVNSISVWFSYGKAAGSLEEVRDNSMATFSVFSTCNNPKGCLRAYSGGYPDNVRVRLLQESLDFAKEEVLQNNLAFSAPADCGVQCYLSQNVKTCATWVAQGLWAVTCNNGAKLLFLAGLSFQRQVNTCLSRRDPEDMVIEANIYGLAFTSGNGTDFPMVVQPQCSGWTKDGIYISSGAPCNVIVHGNPIEAKKRYWMLQAMFTDEHLYAANQLREIDLNN